MNPLGLVNIGLVQRALREIVPTTIVLAGLLATISGLLAYALPRIQARFVQRSFIPPGLQQFRNAVLGADGAAGGISDVAFGIAWTHPVMLILLMTHGIVCCTRVPAGEIERGTIDVLLGLPVSRWQLFVSETASWILGGVVVLGAVYGGSFLGAQFIEPEYRPNFARLGMVLANLTLVYAVVSCGAMLAAALSDRRGRAIMVVIAITVASLLVNFLHTLDSSLEFLKPLAPLSFLHYYKPVGALMRGDWPVRDMTTLALASGAMWVGAGVVMSRRAMTTL